MYGYFDRVLRINLSNWKISTEPLNPQWVDLYIGGKGLGLRYLLEEVPKGVEPLSPQNKIIIMTGPLQGTSLSTTARLVLIAKSPLTGTYSDSYIGGACSYYLKRAGYDALIIEGKASRPVYLLIRNEEVKIEDASSFWGLDTYEVEDSLRKRYGQRSAVLSIGLAGENLVPMACITSEKSRQAGRGGLGAVFGSKNLKAIYIEGSQKPFLPDGGLDQEIKRIHRESVDGPENEWVRANGTPITVEWSQTAGLLPVRNFQEGANPDYFKIGSEAIKKVQVGRKACQGCRIGCRRVIQFFSARIEAPDYETLSTCGSNCGVFDLEAITRFNDLADRYGIDTISLGDTIAFAMELTEKGIHNFGIHFGETEKYLRIPELVAKRTGLGEELALGTKYLSEKYGGVDFAMHVKGQEFPGYDPRGSWTMALAYGTADRGADHNRGWPVGLEAFDRVLDPFTLTGKARLIKEMQDASAHKYSLILCEFWAASPQTQAEVLSLITGKNYTVEDLATLGERVWNIGRIFNIREGFRKKDDLMPQRIHKDPLKEGPPQGKVVPEKDYLEALLEYYELRGWDQNGVPTVKKLKELAIDYEAIEILQKAF